jgi:cyclopropane fatty-acyl-phospholipid synthase-like methyltransferase
MYKEIFLRICRVYVEFYPEHSFSLKFDSENPVLIGNSKNIIKININNSENVFKRIFSEWSIWLGESYCDWNILIKDEEYKYLMFIFVRFAYNKKLVWKLKLLDIFRVLRATYYNKLFSKWTQDADINSHYSLSDWFEDSADSNNFYTYWLNSKYVQYSCWKWDKLTSSLEQAQLNKLDFYAKRLWISDKSKWKTLLDLGCWWWGLIFYMAETYGIKCKWLTLSVAQAIYINEQIIKRWLSDLVSVEIRNIHSIEWKYDYIASVWVMEHIENFNDLYKKIWTSLNAWWKTLIHSMFQTLPQKRIADPFLSKYIFPGAWIPQLKNNLDIFKKYFRYVEPNELPQKSYPKTIECWYINFCKNEDAIRKLFKEKSKIKDIDFAIRVFKHYLVSVYCWLYEDELVVNVLAYN